VTVVDGSLLDHESAGQWDLVVSVSDKKFTTTAVVTIIVNDVNETPTDIGVDNLTVDENVVGGIIGAILVSEPDDPSEPFGQHVFSVDDARFEVADGQLRLKEGETVDYET
jgi:hypothetical protein